MTLPDDRIVIWRRCRAPRALRRLAVAAGDAAWVIYVPPALLDCEIDRFLKRRGREGRAVLRHLMRCGGVVYIDHSPCTTVLPGRAEQPRRRSAAA